ncbi:MAG: mechanosensitive ion channel domain-containing protein [Patescibacteria group bacterium]
MDALVLTLSRFLNVLIVVIVALFAYLIVIILVKRFITVLSSRLPIIRGTTISDPRIKGVITLFLTLARWVLGLCALFIVLNEFNVNIGPLIAGAGVVGIALSFAAQSILKDVGSGITILIGDQFRPGDVIIVNGIQGVVEHVSLMKTIIRDKQILYTIPNGQISTVGVVQSPSQNARGTRHH